METQILLYLAVSVLIVALLGLSSWAVFRWRRSKRLKDMFGSEYDYIVKTRGDRRTAEMELEQRQKRASGLNLHPLDEDVQERYIYEWNSLQSTFVNDPGEAVAEANRLLQEVMVARGFPIGDFEERVADISIMYPNAVTNYRKAWEITKIGLDEASTEDLRIAMLCYRSLFDELLES